MKEKFYTPAPGTKLPTVICPKVDRFIALKARTSALKFDCRENSSCHLAFGLMTTAVKAVAMGSNEVLSLPSLPMDPRKADNSIQFLQIEL